MSQGSAGRAGAAQASAGRAGAAQASAGRAGPAHAELAQAPADQPGGDGALDGAIAAALGEARALETRARRLVLLARIHGGEAAAQAWVDELQRESARSRSAVLARLEHGDLCGALGVALTLVDSVRSRGLDAYGRTLEVMGRPS